jgi:hypothetical protein
VNKTMNSSNYDALIEEERKNRTRWVRQPSEELVEVAPEPTVTYGQEYPTEGLIGYPELLAHSVFTLCPPGDQWEEHRVYEAIEAGSIPIVAINHTYQGCDGPSKHLLSTVPGVIGLESWDELPAAMAAAAKSPRLLKARQQQMLDWLRKEKRAAALGLYATVQRMRSGRWREQTVCDYQPLNAYEVADMQQWLAKYWRRPQPRWDNPWNATAFWAYMSGWCVRTDAGWCEEQEAGSWEFKGVWGRPFKGPDSFCESELDDWAERCMTDGCALRLVYSYECRPSREPKPPERAMW